MGEEKQVVKYATLNKRMIAVSIDMLLITLILNPIMSFLEKIIYMGRTPYMAIMDYAQNGHIEGQTIDITTIVNLFIEEGLLGKFVFMQLVPFCILGVYFVFCWARYGYTFGGYFLSISVRFDDDSQSNISFLRSLMRFLASFLCYLSLGLGYLIMSFNKKRQSVHDKICKTIVIEQKPDFSLVEKLGFKSLSKQ